MKTASIIFLLFCLPVNIFASTRVLSVTLPDGELITYIQRGSISAKQTSIEDLPEKVLMIRQVTDGKELIQAIYSEGTLVDCDLSNRQSEAIQLEIEINEIMSTTNNSHNININNNNNYKNNSIESLENIYTSSNTSLINSWRKSREDLRWLNISKLTRQCLSTQERAISSLVKSRSRRSLLTIKPSRHGRKNRGKKRRRHDRLAKGNKQGLKQKLIPPGTKWCGPSNRARKFGDLGGFWKADKCCRKHDTCAMYILPFSNKYSKVNTSPFTLSHCSCDHRNGEEVLRLPGTAWCGRGYSASHYRQLGPFTAADRCCRRHDTACPYYIPAMDNRYGLYNWRPSTLMHCSCDRRFRNCLKMADTGASNLVGKLFFNVVQTKCFVLKPEKICTKRSWWGKCQKYEYKKLAHIRSNLSY